MESGLKNSRTPRILKLALELFQWLDTSMQILRWNLLAIQLYVSLFAPFPHTTTPKLENWGLEVSFYS